MSIDELRRAKRELVALTADVLDAGETHQARYDAYLQVRGAAERLRVQDADLVRADNDRADRIAALETARQRATATRIAAALAESILTARTLELQPLWIKAVPWIRRTREAAYEEALRNVHCTSVEMNIRSLEVEQAAQSFYSAVEVCRRLRQQRADLVQSARREAESARTVQAAADASFACQARQANVRRIIAELEDKVGDITAQESPEAATSDGSMEQAKE